MLYKLGRFLQMLGLILVPIPLAGNALGSLDLRSMLTFAGTGMLVFFAGWSLQQVGKK